MSTRVAGLVKDVAACSAWSDDTDVAFPIGEVRALIAERDALREALLAAARLADLPNVDAFATYECEHGATLGQCEDEDGKLDCATQDDMALVHAAFAAVSATHGSSSATGSQPKETA